MSIKADKVTVVRGVGIVTKSQALDTNVDFLNIFTSDSATIAIS